MNALARAYVWLSLICGIVIYAVLSVLGIAAIIGSVVWAIDEFTSWRIVKKVRV